MKKISIIVAALFIHNSCQNEKIADAAEKNKLESLVWLEGSWEGVSPEGTASESWEKQGQNSIIGKGYFVNGKDTLSSETLRLEGRGNDVYYVPSVKSQNNGQPVEFKLTTSSGGRWIFENPEHDFPQLISYTRISDDSLVAEISGKIDGREQSQQFAMRRKK